MYICITFFTLNNCVWNVSVGARSEMSLLNLVRTQQPWLLGLGFWFCHAFWTKNCASCGYGKAPPPRRQAGARTQEAGCLIWRRWAVSKLSPACLLAVSEFQIGSNRFLLLLLASAPFPISCLWKICFDLWRNNVVTFYRSSWLRKLACCWCLNVCLLYITVISPVSPDFNCRCEAHSSPSISPGHWAETWKILEISLVFDYFWILFILHLTQSWS